MKYITEICLLEIGKNALAYITNLDQKYIIMTYILKMIHILKETVVSGNEYR